MLKASALVPLSAQAVQAVLAQWKSHWSSLAVLALVPEAERGQIDLLQASCRSAQVELVGAVFPALVSGAGFQTQGVCLIALETMPPHFLLGDLAVDGAARLTEAVRQTMANVGNQRPNLFLVFDAMVPNIGSLLDNVHQSLDLAPFYAGVNAGSETFTPMPCLFDADKVIGDGVLGLLLDTSQRVVVRHAYAVAESLMRATSAEGNRIVMINDRPAFDVYQEMLALEYGVTLTKDNFYDHAVHFPFGVVTVIDVLVRIPVALGDDGSLVCVGEIPPYASLRLLKAPPELEDSECVIQIGNEVRAAVGGDPSTLGLLTFYCAGRRMHFGPKATTELLQLQHVTGADALFGALSLGEIDCANEFGFPRFHNAALVCLAQPGMDLHTGQC